MLTVSTGAPHTIQGIILIIHFDVRVDKHKRLSCRADRTLVQNLREELPGALVLRVAEDLLRRTFLDDLAAVNEHHTIGHAARKSPSRA